MIASAATAAILPNHTMVIPNVNMEGMAPFSSSSIELGIFLTVVFIFGSRFGINSAAILAGWVNPEILMAMAVGSLDVSAT